jgi:large subunit ribosomal protein L25
MAATLTATPREERGKSAARALRRAGKVPAVVYGHGDETRPLTVDAHELQKLLAHSSASTLIDLKIEGGESMQALIREIQHHPTKPGILHLDLYQIHAGETLTLTVAVRVHGTPVGVRDGGGVMQQVLHELNVECLPRDIPEGIDVEVGELEVGDAIHVRDISIANVTILNDGDLTICSVTPPTVAALPEDEQAEEVAGSEQPEPELVRERRGAEDAEAEQD